MARRARRPRTDDLDVAARTTAGREVQLDEARGVFRVNAGVDVVRTRDRCPVDVLEREGHADRTALLERDVLQRARQDLRLHDISRRGFAEHRVDVIEVAAAHRQQVVRDRVLTVPAEDGGVAGVHRARVIRCKAEPVVVYRRDGGIVVVPQVVPAVREAIEQQLEHVVVVLRRGASGVGVDIVVIDLDRDVERAVVPGRVDRGVQVAVGSEHVGDLGPHASTVKGAVDLRCALRDVEVRGRVEREGIGPIRRVVVVAVLVVVRVGRAVVLSRHLLDVGELIVVVVVRTVGAKRRVRECEVARVRDPIVVVVGGVPIDGPPGVERQPLRRGRVPHALEPEVPHAVDRETAQVDRLGIREVGRILDGLQAALVEDREHVVVPFELQAPIYRAAPIPGLEGEGDDPGVTPRFVPLDAHRPAEVHRVELAVLLERIDAEQARVILGVQARLLDVVGDALIRKQEVQLPAHYPDVVDRDIAVDASGRHGTNAKLERARVPTEDDLGRLVDVVVARVLGARPAPDAVVPLAIVNIDVERPDARAVHVVVELEHASAAAADVRALEDRRVAGLIAGIGLEVRVVDVPPVGRFTGRPGVGSRRMARVDRPVGIVAAHVAP